MLSKHKQALYVENLEAPIADNKARLAAKDEEDSPQSQTKRVEPSADARLLMEEGIVREQWQPAGEKIEYFKSHIESAGWNLAFNVVSQVIYVCSGRGEDEKTITTTLLGIYIMLTLLESIFIAALSLLAILTFSKVTKLLGHDVGINYAPMII